MTTNETQPPVISLMGPTGSGKTDLAIAIAKRVNGEIISVDSALIYKHMNIGTAKPSLLERENIPHWLIDIIQPHEIYSVASFRRDVIKCIESIIQRGKVPILAGGTMMYFNALMKGLSDLPESDSTVRAAINEEATLYGWQKLHQELASIDKIAAEKIHENDPQRITRALEVYRLTGKTISALQQIKSSQPPYHFIEFVIMPDDRSKLHQRIAIRFEKMLTQGLVQEVIELRKDERLHLDLPAIRSVGYRQVWQYLDGDVSYAEMKERSVIATRQLAKRQMTWLRGWETAESLLTGSDKNVDIVLSKLGT